MNYSAEQSHISSFFFLCKCSIGCEVYLFHVNLGRKNEVVNKYGKKFNFLFVFNVLIFL